jgi:hypothetical protein
VGSQPWSGQPLALAPAQTYFTPQTKPAPEEVNWALSQIAGNIATLDTNAGEYSTVGLYGGRYGLCPSSDDTTYSLWSTTTPVHSTTYANYTACQNSTVTAASIVASGTPIVEAGDLLYLEAIGTVVPFCTNSAGGPTQGVVALSLGLQLGAGTMAPLGPVGVANYAQSFTVYDDAGGVLQAAKNYQGFCLRGLVDPSVANGNVNLPCTFSVSVMCLNPVAAPAAVTVQLAGQLLYTVHHLRPVAAL